MEISYGRLKLNFDPATGSLLRLQDAADGLVHLEARRDGHADGRLWRVTAPAERWSSRYADSHAQPSVEAREASGGLTFRYPSLLAVTGEALGIAAEVRVTPSPRPDEALFTLRLENHGAATLNEVRFPWVASWAGLGGPGQDRMALGARNFADPHDFPKPTGYTYAHARQREAHLYPTSLYAPWVDLSGPGGGMSLCTYMPEAENGGLSVENLAGYGPGLRLALGWVHYPVLRLGETWTSPPVGLAVHASDWHVTADRYSAWFDGLYPPARRRALFSMIGFQNVFFRGFDGTPIRPLEEIPRVAAIGRQFGVDHLCVWDALTLGNYANRGPLDLTEYPPEERALLRAGLRQAEAEGSHTSALINFRHPNVAQRLADPALQAEIKRRYDGTAQTENWSGSHAQAGLWTRHLGPEGYVFSPFSAAHQERVLRLTREYQDFGYTSMFYDQPFEQYADYGFLAQGHRPEHTHRDAVRLIARVRELLLAEDPNALVIGEECDLHSTPWIDLWMSWRISNLSAIPDARLTRYAIPHAMLCWTVDSEPERAALAFAMGMYLCLLTHGGEGTLADEPELARLVAALARLRRATAERTVEARFVDHRGLTVDGDESLVAHSYDSAAGPAVIVAAVGAPARGRVTLERAAFSMPGGEGQIAALSGEVTPASGDTQEFRLQANEVAVWMA
jgi:hypothetical protein